MEQVKTTDSDNFQERLSELKATKKWSELVAFLEKECLLHENDPFILTELSGAYIMIKEYQKALTAAQKAYQLQSDDVLMIYNYGDSLTCLDRYEEAVVIFDNILKKSISRVAYGFPGEGMRWTMGVFNDARFLKGICLREMGDFIRARRYIKLHLTKRRPGVYSDFSKRQVLKEYNKTLDLIEKSKKST